MVKKAKLVKGWRWTNTETTVSFTGCREFSVAIDEVEQDGRTDYVAFVIHDAADNSSDDRIEKLGTFDRFAEADDVGRTYVARRTGEAVPDYERFDPTVVD